MHARFLGSIVMLVLISRLALPADVQYQLRVLGVVDAPPTVVESAESVSLEIQDRVWVNPSVGGDSSSPAHESESELGNEWYRAELAFNQEAFHVSRDNNYPWPRPIVESTHWIERSLLPLTRKMFYARELPQPDFSPVLCDDSRIHKQDRPSPFDLSR